MNWLEMLQWPAMVITLLGAWLVASKREGMRAWHTGGWALVVLQRGLVVMNVRGAIKNDTWLRPGSAQRRT
jgi:hypothetical protein